MATLTIRMPDDKVERLKVLARSRGLSLNKLIEEWATMGISEFDSKAHFMARAARGSRERGLAALRELDRRDNLPSPAAHPHGFHDSAQNEYDPTPPDSGKRGK